MEFQKYMHVERLGKEEVEGITSGKCYVFPKLDGTNGQIYMVDHELHFGSRKRELTVAADNAGFMNTIKDDSRYKSYLEKYPSRRLYGEWLVKHTIKGYQEDAWRKFYVFDVEDNGILMNYDDYKGSLEEFSIDYIPVQAVLENPTEEQLVEQAKSNVFLMSSGVGEGIVVKNYGYHNKWGNQVWAKIITSEFKVSKHAPKNADVTLESTFVEDLCTHAFIEKEYAKILEEHEWSQKLIPMLLQTIYHELINEELWGFIKKHKNPTINFRVVQRLVTEKVKLTLPQLF